jgi:Flp pilus assembly secretin CpaC
MSIVMLLMLMRSHKVASISLKLSDLQKDGMCLVEAAFGAGLRFSPTTIVPSRIEAACATSASHVKPCEQLLLPAHHRTWPGAASAITLAAQLASTPK